MLNNHSKTNQISATPQMVAGILQSDSNVEFVGITDTQKVIWIQHGGSHYFSDLPPHFFKLLRNAYLADEKAVEFLSKIAKELHRQVELYTYYMYGDLDSTPDIKDGRLMPPENFRESENCPSLLWKKEITIDGKPLTPREIVISDLFKKDHPDKAIALILNISHSHLDSLKRALFQKAGVRTKTAYVLKAIKQQVIRE